MAVTEITSKLRVFPDVAEAWHHRQLAVVLARRNIKARYTQTLLGSIWIIIQPLLLVGIFTVVFGILLAVPSDGPTYVLFAFAGTVFWTGFQRSVSDTGVSLASSGAIILKVYFPRVLVPVSSALTSLVDLIPVYAMLLIVVGIYGQLHWATLALSPIFLLLGVLMGFALGVWITVLDAVFRDIRLAIPSVLQLWLYATPVMYAATIVPERWQWVYKLNPIVGLVNAFRWSMLSTAPPPQLSDLAWSSAFTVFLFGGGLVLFARLETFAVDRI